MRGLVPWGMDMSVARIREEDEGAEPLVVDLEGTLLHSDLLLETGIAFVRRRPLRLFRAS